MSADREVFTESTLDRFDEMLVELYQRTGKAVDDLAYTDDFASIFEALKAAGDKRTEAQVFRRLLNLRKSGRLPRVA